MPMLWRRIAWFASFAIAVALAKLRPRLGRNAQSSGNRLGRSAVRHFAAMRGVHAGGASTGECGEPMGLRIASASRSRKADDRCEPETLRSPVEALGRMRPRFSHHDGGDSS